MAIETVWLPMLAQSIEGMGRVIAGSVNTAVLRKQYKEEENAWVNHGFESGVEAASEAYIDELKHCRYVAQNSLEEMEFLDKRLDQEMDISRDAVRARVLTDCQRAGYIRALGMLKAIIDHTNTTVRDLDGNLIKMNTYINKDGTSGAIYDKKSGTRVDNKEMQDVMHPNGEITLYERCFFEGFRERADYLFQKASAEKDGAVMDTIGAPHQFVKYAFQQTPEDARMFKKLEDAGRYYTDGTVAPEWEKDMTEVMEFFKEKGLTQKELDVLTDDKRSKAITREVFYKEKEQDDLAGQGIQKEYFV